MRGSLTAVVLAAGEGSRLRPYTLDTPKPLVSVGGRPLLGRALDAFAGAGVRDVIVVTGYRAGDIDEFIAARSDSRRIRTVRNVRHSHTNNAYSLALAGPSVPGAALVVDGDLLFEPEIVRRVAVADEDVAIAVERRPDLGPEEIKVAVRDDGAIAAIGKAVPLAAAIGEAIGIARFSAAAAGELWQRLEALTVAGEVRAFYERAFEELAASGRRLSVCDVTGLACREIDTPEDLVAANALAELPVFAPSRGRRVGRA